MKKGENRKKGKRKKEYEGEEHCRETKQRRKIKVDKEMK